MTRWILLVVIAACSHPEPPRPVYAYEEHGEIIGPPMTPMIAPAPIPTKDQPPHVKLKLGHYRNDRHNISVTIDRLSAATEDVADIDPAKLQFDGDAKVWLLEGHHGGNDRIDYVRDDKRVMLQMTSDGHATVYVIDPETDLASSAIELYRDADADPL